MAIIRQPKSLIIDGSTVDDLVGVCIYDERAEVLVEISSLQDLFISIEPEGHALRRLYLVTDPAHSLTYAKVSMALSEQFSSTYSVKIIMSHSQPPVSAFDILPEFNSFTLEYPQAENFIPIWVLVENVSKVNEIVGLDMIIEYS